MFEHLRILQNPALRVPLYGADRNWSDAEPDLTLGVKPPKILIPTAQTFPQFRRIEIVRDLSIFSRRLSRRAERFALFEPPAQRVG